LHINVKSDVVKQQDRAREGSGSVARRVLWRRGYGKWSLRPERFVNAVLFPEPLLVVYSLDIDH
jgi:hypothetical protein